MTGVSDISGKIHVVFCTVWWRCSESKQATYNTIIAGDSRVLSLSAAI